MHFHSLAPLLVLGLCAPLNTSAARTTTTVTATPVPAAPWTQPHDASPAFTPDGATLVFTRGRGLARRLYVSRRHGSTWSAPQRATFSGRWMDMEPTMAPDGSYLVFVSNRPADGIGKALDGSWGGHMYPGRGGNLWRVDLVGNGWGKPRRLSDTVNTGTSTFSPAVAADGSLYFMRAEPPAGVFRLYLSRHVDGRYRAAQPLALGGGDAHSDYDPAVAPDRSFLVFSSDRAPAASNGDHLFIAFATSEGWSKPVDLGVAGNEARLGADHRTLYFSGTDHRIHRLSLAPWLVRHASAKP